MTSIEFRPAGAFASPLFSTQRSSRRAGASGAVASSVVLFVPERSYLFVGLTDGKILCWETDRSATAPRGKENRVLDEHRGDIRCMIFVKELCRGVMFSGAADRCIKMWDLSDPRSGIPCVHSLHGHGGTVLSLEYGSDVLLSASTDGLLGIWRDQSPTKLLRFPAYSIRQTLSPDPRGAPSGTRQPRETWFLSISIRVGEAPSIFAGDSEGYLHIYKPDPSSGDGLENQDYVRAWRRQVHELGIFKVMVVPMESFLITCSFDQKFKTLDSLSGQVIFEEGNPNCVCFNAFSWDPAAQDVIVADEKGNIGFYNVYTESCLVWRNICPEPITQVHYLPGGQRLLALTPHSLRVFDVARAVKFTELNEHVGPIVSIASRQTPQGGLLYTAAMDNTIRMWDGDSLECVKCLKEKKHEITAMVYLPRSNVIITGHENSDLKMWSLDCQADACLRTVTGKSAHSNTISVLTYAALSGGYQEPPDDARSEAGYSTSSVERDVPPLVASEVLIAGSYDRQVSFWRVTLTNDGMAMAKFDRVFLAHNAADDEVLAVAYSATANSIFTGGNAGVIRKWAFAGSRQWEADYTGHTDAIMCFAVDANFLFSGSADRSVMIWETSQGYQLKRVEMHSASVQAIIVMPDSGIAATCAFDGKVVVWDPQVGVAGHQVVATYEQPEEFRALAYVEETRTILVGSESGKIITFPVKCAAGSDEAQEAQEPSGGSSVGGERFAAQPKALSGVETPPSSEDEGDRGILETLRLDGLRAG